MPKEEKAGNSRQSVDLKWKERKGLEENVAFDGSKTEVGGDAEVDGSLTLNSPSDLKTKDGSEGFVDLNTAQTIGGEKTFSAKAKFVYGSDSYIGLATRHAEGGAAILFVDGIRKCYIGGTGIETFDKYFSWPVYRAVRHITSSDEIPTVHHHIKIAGVNTAMVVFDFLSTTDDKGAVTTMAGLCELLDGQEFMCQGNELANGGTYDGSLVSIKFGATQADCQVWKMSTGSYESFETVFLTSTGDPTITDTVADSGFTSAAKQAPVWDEEEE